MKYRKFLAILLALIMVIGLLPFAALADGGQDDQPGYTQGTDPTEDGNPEPQPEPEPEPEPDLVPGVMLLNDTHGEGWTALTKDYSGNNLTEGNYYLGEDITIESSIEISGDVTLCLCGHTLTCKNKFWTFNVTKGTLTIQDCGTGGQIVNDDADGRYVVYAKGGSVILQSGTLSLENSTSSAGYAVNVAAGSAFTMDGGSVVSNKTGVRNAGTATISGGRIQAQSYGVFSTGSNANVSVTGGNISGETGIYISNGTLNVSGNATISGTNEGIHLSGISGEGTAISGGSISGGTYGIYQSGDAPLYLAGKSTISGEDAGLYIGLSRYPVYASKDSNPYSGGELSVYFNGSTSTTDPIIRGISNNSQLFKLVYPEGKYLAPGTDPTTLVLSDQAPTPPVEKHQHDINSSTGETEWTKWDGSAFTNAGNYYLDKNITLESSITIRENISLCLNGCTITYSGASPVFTVDGGSLTICDCSTNQAGTIKYDYQSSNCQAIKVNKYGTLNLYGGKVDGSGSRGIFCNGGKVNVYGGTITVTGNNSAIDTKGGTVTLSGGTVSGNIRLWTRVTLNLGTSTITGSVVMRNSATCEGYENTINACANDEAYNGDIITITPDPLDGDIPVDTVIVHNATEEQASLFSLEGYDLIYKNGTLVVGGDEIELNVTISESIEYGDTCQVSVSGAPEGATVSYQIEGNTPRERAKISPEGLITPYTTGTFTVTVTADCEGYAQKTVHKTLTVLPKAITITAEDQHLEYGDTIEKDVHQVAVTTLVAGDTLDSIVLTAGDTDIAPSDAVIKKGNEVVTTYYTITYEPGTLTFYNVPQDELTITGQPEPVTYGDTFTLTATGGSTTGTVTWRATGAADVDDEGNVTITGAGTFIITATKAGNDTYAAATATYKGTAQKRALTITADDETIAFNAAEPSYTATVTGAVKADEEAIADAYTLSCSYQKGNSVGEYPITVTLNLSTDLLAKYNVMKEDGTLHVVKALAEVEDAPDAVLNLVYTGNAQKLVTPGTAKNGTMFYSLDGEKYDEAVPTGINAGDYTVWYKVIGNSGYSDTAAASFTVKIAKAPLTVTADDIWVYAGDTPKFTATIEGYVNGEDWHVLGGKLTFTCDYSEKYSKPGSRHTITPKGLKADNYDITFEDGILTVKDPLSPRFNVYVLESKHGTVEADCRYARKDDVVTLTIKPDWGYALETLTVTDSHGDALKLTYHNNGTYTFTMPRDNVTVKAVFTVRDMPFVDVPGDAWYAGGVRYVYAHGLMNGTGNWRFSPNRTTTRAMIATILYRMEGSPRVYGTSQFTDVKAGSWYEDAVIWATQNDIVEGYTSKSFGPNDPITREQMAAMLYRYADYCRCDMSAGRYIDLSKYSDMNEISAYAIPALRWAVGEEIIQGRTGKRLAPTDTATRAEVAMMLMRFCEDVIW